MLVILARRHFPRSSAAGIQEAAPRQTTLAAEHCSSQFGCPADGPNLATYGDMSVEIALGRWLACAVHPQAAWHRSRARERALLVATYMGAGYVATLIVLITAR